MARNSNENIFDRVWKVGAYNAKSVASLRFIHVALMNGGPQITKFLSVVSSMTPVVGFWNFPSTMGTPWTGCQFETYFMFLLWED